MNYEEFLNYVKDSISKYMGEDYTVTLNNVMKNNGLELTGLVIMKKGQMAAPTIYLDEFYEQYNMGSEMKTIFEEIMKLYEQNSENLDMDFSFFTDFVRVRDKILYKLLNYEENRQLLEDVPYKRFLDLAVVFYVEVNNDMLGYGSVLIHNNHLDVWNITEKELYEVASENTPKHLKYRISSMEEVFEQMLGNTPDFTVADDNINSSLDMYVLTNCNMVFGASCMMYDGLIKKISDILNGNLYILPSSIHEVIIIPQNKFCDNKEELCNMVRCINEREVGRTERLSNSVYEYVRERDEICI